MDQPGADLSPLERKFSALARLSAPELEVLRAMADEIETCRPGEQLQVEGAAPGSPRVVLAGWACHFRLLPNGRRQVFAFVLPGDVIGDVAGKDTVALSGISALTQVHFGDATPLRAALAEDAAAPGLAQGWNLNQRLNEAALLNHVVRLGCQSAYERMAHLFLELEDRLRLVGLAENWRFAFPLTQDTLADALGLSLVHVNRTAQHLRRDGLIALSGGYVHLRDPARLAHIASYRAPSG